MTIFPTRMSAMRRSTDKPIYFAKEDKLQFLNIISKYKNYFEDNDWTEYNVKSKSDIWTLIEQEYNGTSPKTGNRTVDQLRSLYKNLKRKAKNDALREIEHFKSSQGIPVITAEEFANQINRNFNENTEKEIENDHSYGILDASPKSDTDSITELTHPSTSGENELDHEEILVEPVINIESLQNAVRTKRYRRRFSDSITRIKPEPVLNSRRFVEEQYKLKLKILKTECEAKKREAAFNHEIYLIQKEIAWKNKENAILDKKIKLEEMQERKTLMKLKQENELLKQKLLKLEIEKLQKALNKD